MSRDYLKIAHQYAEDVMSGKVVAGKYEKLASKRFLNDLKRVKNDVDFEYHLSADRATHACFFIETLNHVKGSLARPDKNGNRARLIMEPWQVFVTVNLFGWINAEGIRRFHYCYIEIAKKNGKSTWASAIGLYMTIADGEPGAEVYAAATNYDQAKIVWADAKQMVVVNQPLQARFGVSSTQYLIKVEDTNSVFMPLATDKEGSKDGKNVHCGILDELHAHKDSNTYDIIADGIVAREQPLILAITTAGDDRTGVCYRERSTVVSILEGKSNLDRYFGLIFALDRGDDWKDPKNWVKANPCLGVSVPLTYLLDKFDKVTESPSMEARFRQKSLNEWVGSTNSWISSLSWDAAYDATLQKDSFKGLPGFGGLDLASRMDLAGFGRLFPWKVIDDKVHWAILSRHYINSRVVDSSKAINGEKRPDDYMLWAQQGWLTVTDGNTTDFDLIERDVMDSHIDSQFYEVGFDIHNANQMGQHLVESDIQAVEVPMRWQFLSPAMKWIEVLLAEGRLHHMGDPVLAWCMTNVIVVPDANENIFPRKPNAAKKIDAALGLITAAARAMYHDNLEVMDLVAGNDGDFDDYLANIVSSKRK
jgi:phage terminase large subunit-like protein